MAKLIDSSGINQTGLNDNRIVNLQGDKDSGNGSL